MSSIESVPGEKLPDNLPDDFDTSSIALCKRGLDDVRPDVDTSWWEAPVTNRPTAAFHTGRLINQLGWHLQYVLFFGLPTDKKRGEEVLCRLVEVSYKLTVKHPNQLAEDIASYRDIFNEWLFCEAAGDERAACYDPKFCGESETSEKEINRDLFAHRVRCPLQQLRDRICSELSEEERWALSLGECLDEGLRRSDVHRYFEVEFSAHEDPSPVEEDYWCDVCLEGRETIRTPRPGELKPDNTWPGKVRGLLTKLGVTDTSLEATLSTWEQAEPQDQKNSMPRTIEQLDRCVREHLVVSPNNDGPSDPISFDDIGVLAGKTKKRVQNCVSEWRKGDEKIPDPCSYVIVRPFIIKEWGNKAIMFPEDYERMLEYLAAKKADLPRKISV